MFLSKVEKLFPTFDIFYFFATWDSPVIMLQIHSTSTYSWLSIYIITVELHNQSDEELLKLINETIKPPGIIILNQSYSWDIFNTIQLKIINNNKQIIVLFIKGSIIEQTRRINGFVQLIDELILNIDFEDISKEKLAFLMLNIPGFMEYLELNQHEESLESTFQKFVLHNNSIKKIIHKLK